MADKKCKLELKRSNKLPIAEKVHKFKGYSKFHGRS